MKEYREEHSKGEIIFNFRIGYKINDHHKILFIIRNAFNREYMVRPADVQAPRTFALQYHLDI